jgi:hypothetical protein
METNLNHLLAIIGRQAVENDLLRSQLQELQDRLRKVLAEKEFAKAKSNGVHSGGSDG